MRKKRKRRGTEGKRRKNEKKKGTEWRRKKRDGVRTKKCGWKRKVGWGGGGVGCEGSVYSYGYGDTIDYIVYYNNLRG